MNRRRLLSLLVPASLFPASAALAAAEATGAGGWRTIMDGKSLAGWTPLGDANWRLEDGAAVADKGNGFLISDQTYGDFELTTELWVSDDANSGIFARITNPTQISPGTFYEFNVYDQRPDPTYGTGGISGLVKAPVPPIKCGGRWSTITVMVRGDHLTMKIDGKTTAEGTDARLSRGRVGLQGFGGTVKFRNVRIREIT